MVQYSDRSERYKLSFLSKKADNTHNMSHDIKIWSVLYTDEPIRQKPGRSSNSFTAVDTSKRSTTTTWYSWFYSIVRGHAFYLWLGQSAKISDLSFIWGYYHLHVVDDRSNSRLFCSLLLHRALMRPSQVETAVHGCTGFHYGLHHDFVALSLLLSYKPCLMVFLFMAHDQIFSFAVLCVIVFSVSKLELAIWSRDTK